jgi:NADP-dependent aldehyde dehydrogenase
VFTEMTSVNPTFILPAALSARGGEIGDGFIERMLVNVGQACLCPSILIAVEGEGLQTLRSAMIKRVSEAPARTMLTPGVHGSYVKGLVAMESVGAKLVAVGAPMDSQFEGRSALLEVDGQRLLSEPALAHEVFGPAALLVTVNDEEELLAVARSFKGQLSAAIHLEDRDLDLARRLLPILERRTGRIVVNAFAHPQEVTFATVHGGPFPATSDSRFTSVGMTSIERFLRPVAYQGFPDALLPQVLRDGNPLELPRSIDGQ